METKEEMLNAVSRIVSAYISHNTVRPSDIDSLIRSTYESLTSLGCEAAQRTMSLSGVSAEDSVTDDYIVCLEDGKKLKMLKRHLRTAYGMTPQQYRERWGLPLDYPMVAPNYAKRRSMLARNYGLGHSGNDTNQSGSVAI